MRVLLLAEQANPEFVSVPLVGWSHARAIAQLPGVEAHLVTQVRNREAILRAGLTEGQDFTAIDSEKVAARMHRLSGLLRGGKGKGWTTVMALNAVSYAYFEKLLWRQFGPAIKAKEFDLVHRITPLSPTLPSGRLATACQKAGVPFIWGPINGGVPWPKAFNAARRSEREWLSYVRGAYKLLPGYHRTRSAASALLVGSADTLAQVDPRYRSKCVYQPENAIDPSRFAARRTPRFGDETKTHSGPVRMIFVGRLVPYKGADLLLEATTPLLKSGQATLTILGDGPDRPRLQQMIEREQLAAAVDLPGWVDHAQLPQRLATHDLFTFPSIREFGGGVVLEAMAVGLPPVVVDYGGPRELVTDATGWRVALGTRESIIAALRQTLTTIVQQPHTIEPKAAAAQRRVMQHFTWSAKAQQTLAVYRAVLAGQPLPDFGLPLPDGYETESAAPDNTSPPLDSSRKVAL